MRLFEAVFLVLFIIYGEALGARLKGIESELRKMRKEDDYI
jgi:hypothetical protein